jgi:hypothetical protein
MSQIRAVIQFIRMPTEYLLQFLIGAVLIALRLVLFLLRAHMGFCLSASMSALPQAL